MRADPGGQQLVRAEPQHLAQRRVEPVQVAVAADGEHRVVAALAAQRAVGQLGGQRRVPPGQAALGQQRRQQQVGVGVPLGHGAQHVERRPAGRIRPAAGGPARAGRPRRPRPRPGPCPLARTLLSAHLAPVSRAPRRGRRAAGRAPSRRPASAACRAAARRRAAPGAVAGADQHPRPGTRSSPGPGRRPRSSGAGPANGQSLILAPSSAVHAPGAGVQARISRLDRRRRLTPSAPGRRRW